MESMLIILALAGCLPSIVYLAYLIIKRIGRRIRHVFPSEGLTQVVLVAVSMFCFGSFLFLVFWNFATPPPYYYLEKSLVIALLFLLMGILCLQVLQFIRLQDRQRKPIFKVNTGANGVSGGKRIARPFAVTNSKN